ncbi:MAG: phage major capsid protein [Gammaproteobacteria bacterium]
MDVREIGERLEEKHDAIDVDKVSKLDEKVGEISEEISKLNVLKIGQEKAAVSLEEMKEQMAVMAAQGDSSGEGTDEKAKAAFGGFLRSTKNEDAYADMIGDIADGLLKKEFHCFGDNDLVKKNLVVGNDGNGGFLAPTEFGGIIIARIFETSPVRTVANVMTTAMSEIEFILDDDEPDADWVGEISNRADTNTPTVGQVIIPAHELFAQPKASQKLLDDAGIDIEAWLAGKVSRKFSRVENTAFVIGNGSQKPRGFLDYADRAVADVYERNTVEQVASGFSASFDSDSFKTLQNSLIEDYQGSAVWMMKRATWSDVTKLKDSQNRYLFDMISNFRDGDVLQVLGHQVILADDMPVQAADSLSVVYADFGEFYTIVDRIGIRVLRDPFTSKPFVKFYTTKRTGAAVTNFEAGKIMKLAA